MNLAHLTVEAFPISEGATCELTGHTTTHRVWCARDLMGARCAKDTRGFQKPALNAGSAALEHGLVVLSYNEHKPVTINVNAAWPEHVQKEALLWHGATFTPVRAMIVLNDDQAEVLRQWASTPAPKWTNVLRLHAILMDLRKLY
jgi:hypothetical protein